jgi:hypothetical protein
MAALDNLVRTPQGPEAIKRAIQVSGDKALVTLHVGMRSETIEIALTLPLDGGDHHYALRGFGPTQPIWPALLEKAIAAKFGGYGAVQGRKSFTAATALKALTGGGHQLKYAGTEQAPDHDYIGDAKIRECLENHIPVLALSGNHAWSVRAADDKTITLRNPNADIRAAEARPLGDEEPLRNDHTCAIVILSWDRFRKEFDGGALAWG